MDQALATAPMRWWVLRSTNTGYNHAGSLPGFKATSSNSDSDSEPARRAGDGAGSGSEPESSSSRRDLDLLRLLPPARLVDI